MKNIIKSGFLLASFLVVASSCTKEPDMTYMDKWLGEDFNQELLWDPDSLAFHRAKWTVENVTEGVQVRKAHVKMLGAARSISYLSYSPDGFKTYVGYSDQPGTVAEMASAHENALFAISGMNLNGSTPSGYLKYDGNVINPTTQTPSDINGVLAIPSSSATNIFSIYECSDGNYAAIEEENAMAAGTVLIVNGEEQTFPEGGYYSQRTARSIIGMDASTGNYVFATIDKGAAGEAEGATIAEAAFIARMIGLTEAVCLADGDGAAIWGRETGVINEPSAGDDQKVASVIYVGINEPSLEGEGTAESPYIIDMPVKMKQMRKYAPAGGETYFKLTKDINMSTVKTWFPVNWDGEFSRKIHFDGNGKTITNFSPNAFVDNVNTSTETNYPSLFGVLYGSCKDLTIKDSKLSVGTKPSAGFLGGYVGTANKPGLVENVHIVNCEIEGNNSTYGGIAGNAREATIRNCTVDIVIRAGGADVGGIAGIGNGTVTIENCTAKVDLAPQKDPGSNMRYGGLVGYHKGSTITIRNCSTSGIIACGYSCNTSGGILAYSGSSSSTTISQCKSTVDMKKDSGKYLSNSGGMVGVHGSAGTCTIENCYSTGDMYVHQVCGGIVGRQENGTMIVRNCYSTSPLDGFSGLGSLVGAASKTTCNLQMFNCIGWAPSIKASREDTSKYGSGALVGSSSGKNTFTNCVRRADMTISDKARGGFVDKGDVNNAELEGTPNTNRPYDGTPSTESTVSAAAKKAGWNETVWDLSGELPELVIFKK